LPSFPSTQPCPPRAALEGCGCVSANNHAHKNTGLSGTSAAKKHIFARRQITGKPCIQAVFQALICFLHLSSRPCHSTCIVAAAFADDGTVSSVSGMIKSDLFKNQSTIQSLSQRLTSTEKMALYTEYKKDPWVPFLINFLVGAGIGSFIEGDTTGGAIALTDDLRLYRDSRGEDIRDHTTLHLHLAVQLDTEAVTELHRRAEHRAGGVQRILRRRFWY
jgi:hypothetical protein